MMGSKGAGQAPLFYAFSLEDQIPADHLLRGIDRFLDLSPLRQHLAPFYSHTGRPSVDPELMIRMLVIGYCFGIRSERRLCEEVHLNLAHRWICRLGLEDRIPDHSTFSKNRHGRFRQSDAFRHVLETVLRRCMGEGLVGGEGFAIDASVIKADANRARGVPGGQEIKRSQGEGPSRAVREYLSALDATNPTDDDEPPAPASGPSSRPKDISLTDPAARWTAAPGGPACYAYSTNYLIDLDAGIIVDVEATPAPRTEEVNTTETMIERVERQFDRSEGGKRTSDNCMKVGRSGRRFIHTIKRREALSTRRQSEFFNTIGRKRTSALRTQGEGRHLAPTSPTSGVVLAGKTAAADGLPKPVAQEERAKLVLRPEPPRGPEGSFCLEANFLPPL